MRTPILLFLLGEVSLRSNDKENCYRLEAISTLNKMK